MLNANIKINELVDVTLVGSTGGAVRGAESNGSVFFGIATSKKKKRNSLPEYVANLRPRYLPNLKDMEISKGHIDVDRIILSKLNDKSFPHDAYLAHALQIELCTVFNVPSSAFPRNAPLRKITYLPQEMLPVGFDAGGVYAPGVLAHKYYPVGLISSGYKGPTPALFVGRRCVPGMPLLKNPTMPPNPNMHCTKSPNVVTSVSRLSQAVAGCSTTELHQDVSVGCIVAHSESLAKMRASGKQAIQYNCYVPDLTSVPMMVHIRSQFCITVLSDVVHPHEPELGRSIKHDLKKGNIVTFELPKEYFSAEHGYGTNREPIFLPQRLLPPGFEGGCVFGPGTLPEFLFKSRLSEAPPQIQHNPSIMPPVFVGLWKDKLTPSIFVFPNQTFVVNVGGNGVGSNQTTSITVFEKIKSLHLEVKDLRGNQIEPNQSDSAERQMNEKLEEEQELQILNDAFKNVEAELEDEESFLKKIKSLHQEIENLMESQMEPYQSAHEACQMDKEKLEEKHEVGDSNGAFKDEETDLDLEKEEENEGVGEDEDLDENEELAAYEEDDDLEDDKYDEELEEYEEDEDLQDDEDLEDDDDLEEDAELGEDKYEDDEAGQPAAKRIFIEASESKRQMVAKAVKKELAVEQDKNEDDDEDYEEEYEEECEEEYEEECEEEYEEQVVEEDEEVYEEECDEECEEEEKEVAEEGAEEGVEEGAAGGVILERDVGTQTEENPTASSANSLENKLMFFSITGTEKKIDAAVKKLEAAGVKLASSVLSQDVIKRAGEQYAELLARRDEIRANMVSTRLAEQGRNQRICTFQCAKCTHCSCLFK